MNRLFARLVILAALWGGLVVMPVYAQDDAPATDFDSADSLLDALNAAAEAGTLDALYDALDDADRIPYIVGEDVVFLYQGEAESVQWVGDWVNWDLAQAAEGTQIGETLWVHTETFPTDARLEYKIVLDGTEYILDPENDREQWGGFGPNSEFAMPDYVYEPLVEARPDQVGGTVSADASLYSASLGYTVNYRVYKPAGYDPADQYPVIYVTDGQEYLPRRFGAMQTVLDNMIADGSITPVMAVFIDPRDNTPARVNRREEQFLMNPDYLSFVSDELVPLIDALYATDVRPSQRAILGTSFGGVNSAYFALNRADTFGLVAMQSPAFWATPELFDLSEVPSRLPRKIFIASGNPQWDSDIRQVLGLFALAEVNFMSMIVNEGHSWGQWRAQIDDILSYFYGVADE